MSEPGVLAGRDRRGMLGRLGPGGRLLLLPRGRRDLRFASGLVLFTYITMHLGCHALGLVSLGAAEAALDATAGLWQSLPGTALLYGAALVHVGLALLAIYERRTLRMPPMHALRMVLGLVMPIALIGHFVGTRYAYERYGLAPEYPRVVAILWSGGGRDLALGLLAPGWLHGCLGLRFALSTRRAWQRARLPLFAFALLLPVLAAVGFVTMGRAIEAGRAAGILRAPTVTVEQVANMIEVRDDVLAAYLGLLGLVAGARVVRALDERRRRALVRITYPGRTVDVPRGWTVLEASRSHGVPHQSSCGGRARCTTCRVRILEGEVHCPAPQGDERRTLERIRAPAHVRLACQLRPTGDVAVEPVLRVEAAGWIAPPPAPPRLVEREAALLGVDVRIGGAVAGTPASAHDAFYAIDRHRVLVEAAVAATGGVVCEAGTRRWIALYGLDGKADATRLALDAARRLEAEATALGERLRAELDLHAACTLAVHLGPVVAGAVGSGGARRHAATGEAVDAVEEMLAHGRRDGVALVLSERAFGATGADAAPMKVSGNGATARA